MTDSNGYLFRTIPLHVLTCSILPLGVVTPIDLSDALCDLEALKVKLEQCEKERDALKESMFSLDVIDKFMVRPKKTSYIAAKTRGQRSVLILIQQTPLQIYIGAASATCCSLTRYCGL